MPFGFDVRSLRTLCTTEPHAASQTVPKSLKQLEDRCVPSIIFDNATTASVTDGGGLVLDQVHVELIFWGSGWETGQAPAFPIPGASRHR